MKGITLCAECAYYSMKKHRCTRGATNDHDPRDRFYADCPLPEAHPVWHGRWKVDEFGHFCSACGEYAPTEDEYGFAQMHYCPNCGAKMDGDSNG